MPDRGQCATCGGSLAVGCVFCGWASPLGSVQCRRCGEAFEGAQQRKQQRDTAKERAEWTKVAGQGVAMVGSVAMANPSIVSSVFGAIGDIASSITDD